MTPATERLPPVCILAGGRATRLGERAREQPKALMEVAGEPFINHQLRLLAGHGAGEVVVCVGHLGEQIEQALGDGNGFGLDLSLVADPPGLAGTAGAVRGAIDSLGERFLVLYGDTYLRIDYGAFARTLATRREPGLMSVLRNEGRWDTSNVEFADGIVVRHDKARPSPAMEWIDYGLGGFEAEVFTRGPGAEAADLSDVYARLAQKGELAGFEATERFYEIGTPESLAETDAFLRAETREDDG